MRSEIQKKKDREYETIKMENFYDLADFHKSLAHSVRCQIVSILKTNQGITLNQLTEHIDLDFRALAFHTTKLQSYGLVFKKFTGVSTQHYLTRKGRAAFNIIRDLQKGIRIRD